MVSLSENLTEFVRNVDAQLRDLQAQMDELQRERAIAIQSLDDLSEKAPETTPREIKSTLRPPEAYWRMSIGDMVLAALEESFPHGANANELLDHFSTAYGRDGIKRTTLSPQLTRLKNDNKVVKNGRVWTLA